MLGLEPIHECFDNCERLPCLPPQPELRPERLYFRPMMRIFGASFDWETAFSVIEEENRQDEYYMDPDEEEVWYCDVCEKVFRSERHAKIGNCDCKDSKTE